MVTDTRRFPRATLFARTAQLQAQLETWMGKTSLDLDALEKMPDQGERVKRLRQRHESLRGAWLKVRSARQALYECP